MINTESVPKVSRRKIRSVSGFIVIVNYAVTSRRLQESANPLSGMSFTARRKPSGETDIPDRGFADTLLVFVKH